MTAFRPGACLTTARGRVAARAAALALVVLAAGLARPAGALELEDCRISAGPAFPGIKARCGRLERPLNPEDPAAGSISLSVAVVPALDLEPESDPIVPLAGGPGQGAIQFYAAYAAAFEPLRRDRDILLVDQRGTGDSAELTCPTDESLLQGELSDEQTRELTTACLDELPHDPRFFTTSVAVRDLEAVREALAYPSLNVYGVSYGSRVAQHYARRFPAHTRSIVLDGVVPPDLPLGPDIALEAQYAVDNILVRCQEDSACAEAFPDVGETFESLKRQLTASPVELTLADPVSGDYERIRFGRVEFAAAIRLMAYHPNTIALIPLLVHEAAAGNYEPLARQYVMTTRSIGDSIAIGMHNAVMCTEDVPRYAPAALDEAALQATYMGSLLVDTMETVCAVWPEGLADEDLNEPLETSIPTLLLSGGADPITPPGYATRAAAGLRRAWLLTGVDQGHGQLAVGCMPDVVAGFVAAAELEDGAAECVDESFVMPFFLSFSGPAP